MVSTSQRPTLAVVRPDRGAVSWAEAGEAFLRRDIAPTTRRIYALTLDAVDRGLGDRPLAEVDRVDLERAVAAAYGDAAPATWNRVVATVRSFVAYAARMGWVQPGLAAGLERRRVVEDHGRALSREQVERILTRRESPVRDRALWRLLYETAARANEVLGLNVEDVDLQTRRAITTRKGGDRDTLHFQTGSARLLPKVIDGRAFGPLFLSSRRAGPDRAVALRDVCPETGLHRLSYRRAADAFSEASGGCTLHQLRHAAITHLAEEGVPLPLLMAKSRHESLRTLQRYARPSADAVAALTAEHDPYRRR